ncbi:hypothetical protein [Methylobacter svalbardensis]|uniref:hypothetical protein n=1 Tax=Methylobacter svalbardensis TaxID=3080016 RepID=UPI0030EF62C8
MAYVIRDADGNIMAVSPKEINSPEWEFIDAHSREYLGFLEWAIAEQDPFRESDIQLARVLEDLISMLIERDLIRFTDFSEPAQKRLIERQTMRKSSKQLNLIDDEQGLF